MKAAAEVLDKLRAARLRLATVESCTGGLIASRITSIAGASDVYWGGWVVYDNSAKMSQVGVPEVLIRAHGAVSREVAVALAEGGLTEMQRALCDASASKSAPPTLLDGVCVATTGVAGPGGGTAQKPAGLCWIAVARSGLPTRTLEVRLSESSAREELQTGFANAALGEVLAATSAI